MKNAEIPILGLGTYGNGTSFGDKFVKKGGIV